MAQTLLFRRGLKANLPVEARNGEMLVTLDTGEVYLGTGIGSPIKRISDTIKSDTEPAAIDQDKVWLDTVNNIIKVYKAGSWQVVSTPAGTDFGTF